MSKRNFILIYASLVGLSTSWFALRVLAETGERAMHSVPLAVRHAFENGRHRWDSDLTVKQEETIQKSFTLNASGGPKTLDIDNIFGSIDVVAGTSDQVQMVVRETIRAESKEKVELARKEVTLDTSQKDNSLELYVDGPFRCHEGDHHHCVSDDGDRGYVVTMDFQLQVPPNLALKLRTVNDGHIRVQGVTGDFSVHNVNGGIEMLEMAGSGSVKTVNGPVKVTFRDNPHSNSDFGSINGDVELQFAHNLSADFRFKTLNGNIYTDYTLSALPARDASTDRRDGKLIIRTDRYTRGRVGSGGPEIKVENLNGEIRVLEHHV